MRKIGGGHSPTTNAQTDLNDILFTRAMSRSGESHENVVGRHCLNSALAKTETTNSYKFVLHEIVVSSLVGRVPMTAEQLAADGCHSGEAMNASLSAMCHQVPHLVVGAWARPGKIISSPSFSDIGASFMTG
jgi:hypothetical protein